MLNLWQIMLSVSICLLVLLTTTASGFYYQSHDAVYNQGLQDTSDLLEGAEFTRQIRGNGVRRVAFPCNGHDHLARCLHNGRGPRKTMTKAGRFCVCLCPNDWVGPECGYSADSLKKRYPWSKAKRSNEILWDKADPIDFNDDAAADDAA